MVTAKKHVVKQGDLRHPILFLYHTVHRIAACKRSNDAHRDERPPPNQEDFDLAPAFEFERKGCRAEGV